MMRLRGFLLAALVILAPVSLYSQAWTGDADFDFYFGELQSQRLEPEHPMRRLIEDALIESVFRATDDRDFKYRLALIQRLAETQPDRIEGFIRFDAALSRRFREKLDKAKEKRKVYAASGALIGAIVAIPAGRVIGGSWKSLWISIPTGVLTGGGLGFLLAQLTQMPQYEYVGGMITSPLEFDMDEIDRLIGPSD